MADVFISYSTKDLKLAEALKKLLARHGKDVFLDKDRVRLSDPIDFVVAEQLRSAQVVITIWTPNSVASPWVNHETSYAVVEGKSAMLVVSPLEITGLAPFYQLIRCDDFEETRRDPSRLLDRINQLADPARRRRGSRIDVSRLPTTFAPTLFGREKETADLFRAWDSRGAAKTNIVALDAMGGTGKTALVRDFIDRMRQRGWRGAQAVFAWSFYSQGTAERRQGSAEQFLETALRWFGHEGDLPATQHDRGVRLADLVASRRTLLVLDGLEPLQYPAGRSGGGVGPLGVAGALKELGLVALFRQLAFDNPGLLVLTTRLSIPELNGFQSRGVVSYALDRIATEPGIQLLKSFKIKGSDRELAKAVEEFRGHALALSCLGSYIANCTPDARISRRDSIPALIDLEGQQERHPFRVMKAYENSFRSEIDELTKKGSVAGETAAGKQLALLYLIGLFDRPVDRAALNAILLPPTISGLTDGLTGLTRSQWDTAISALRRLGLLAPRAVESDVYMDAHPLVREFFGRRLHEINPDAWRAAHARLWQHYARAADLVVGQSADDMTDVENAITHATLAGETAAALALYESKVARNIRPRGLYALDISVLLNFFAEPWIRLSSDVPVDKQTLLFAHAQNSLQSSGRLAEASDAAQQTSAIWRSQGIWAAYVKQRVELVQILIKLGRLGEAITEATAALRIARTENVNTHIANLLSLLGHAHHMAGDLATAETVFQELEQAETDQYGRKHLSAVRQFNRNELSLDRGMTDQVRAQTEEALKQDLESVARLGIRAVALAHLSLGRLELIEAEAYDDPARKARALKNAASHLRSSLSDLRNNNQLDELPRALVLMAAYHRRIGDFKLAHRNLDEALHIAELFRMPLLYVDACLETPLLEWASGQQVRGLPAARHLAEAAKLIDANGYKRRRTDLIRLQDEDRSRPAAVVPAQTRSAEPVGLLRRIFGGDRT